jgi:hypothetical protein
VDRQGLPGQRVAGLAGADGPEAGEARQTGGTLDVRTLPAGTQEIGVRVTAPDGGESIAMVGSYDPESGARIGPPAGL